MTADRLEEIRLMVERPGCLMPIRHEGRNRRAMVELYDEVNRLRGLIDGLTSESSIKLFAESQHYQLTGDGWEDSLKNRHDWKTLREFGYTQTPERMGEHELRAIRMAMAALIEKLGG